MTSGARMLLHYCDGGVTTIGEKAPRERGRPARTNLGIASPISSTRIERQRRHGSASAGPRRFPPAGGAGCGIAGKLSGPLMLCFGRAQAISTGRRGGLRHRRETERQPKG